MEGGGCHCGGAGLSHCLVLLECLKRCKPLNMKPQTTFNAKKLIFPRYLTNVWEFCDTNILKTILQNCSCNHSLGTRVRTSFEVEGHIETCLAATHPSRQLQTVNQNTATKYNLKSKIALKRVWKDVLKVSRGSWRTHTSRFKNRFDFDEQQKTLWSTFSENLRIIIHPKNWQFCAPPLNSILITIKLKFADRTVNCPTALFDNLTGHHVRS